MLVTWHGFDARSKPFVTAHQICIISDAWFIMTAG